MEKHASTAALLRKLMGLPAADPAVKEEAKKDKPVESAKVESAAGDK
jgi:hypothetical protein